MKLLPRIFVSVILPTLVVVAATLGLGLALLEQSMREEFDERAHATLSQYLGHINLGLEDGRDVLRIASRSPAMLSGQPVLQVEALRQWQGASQRFESFYLLDRAGNLHGRTELASPNFEREVAKMLAQPHAAMADPSINTDSGELVLLLNAPVFDAKGQPQGQFGASLKLAPILAMAVGNTMAGDARLLVLDRQRRLLAGGLGEEGQALLLPTEASAPQTTALLAALGSGAPTTTPKVARVDVGSQVWYALQLRVPELDWQLIYAQPETSLFARVSTLKRIGLFSILCCFLLALAGAARIHRLVMRPLQQLMEAHQALQAGERRARAPVGGDSEFSDLAASFNQMALALDTTEQRFRLVFQAIPHPITLLSLSSGKYVDVNPAFEQFAGMTREQALRSGPMDLKLFDSRADMEAELRELLAKRELRHLSTHRSNEQGVTRWLLYSSTLFEQDGETLVLSVATDISELKLAQAKLEQSEQSFTALFQSAPVPMARSPLTENLVQTYWNEAWYRCYGYKPEQCEGLGGHRFEFWVDPLERSRFIDDLVRFEMVIGREVQLRHADGSIRVSEVSGRYIAVKGERTILTSYVDVTEARLAERALRDSESRFRQLFESAPVAMLHADSQGHILAVNQEWTELMGYSATDTPSIEEWWRIAYPDPHVRKRTRAGWLNRIQQSRLSGGKIEAVKVQLHNRAGDLLTTIVGGMWVGGNLLLSYFDVTETEKAEAAVQLSQRQLLANLENTPAVAVQWFDEAGRVLYWNPASAALYGYSSAEMLGHTLEGTLCDAAGAAAVLRNLQAIQRSGQPYGPIEAQVRRRDGTPLWILATTFAMPLEGERIGFVSMDVDITHRKQVEAQLSELNSQLEQRVQQRTQELASRNGELAEALRHLQLAQGELVHAEKLASLGRLVAGIAHELNTPIGNALLMASTLVDRQKHFEDCMQSGLRRSELQSFLATLREAGAMLEASLHRASELISSFKQVAVDQSSHQRREFDLRAVVHETALSLGPSLRLSGVTLIEQIPPGLLLDSYPGPLVQVLMNIINNAVLHAFAPQQGGTVTVRAQGLGEHRVLIELSDDGCGMPPEVRARIFDPFFTTKLGQGGSGLGLHIVYNLVTGPLGGRIELSSELGRGSTARIELPLQAPYELEAGLAQL